MKKRFFLPFFISLFSLSFSFHLEEYRIFNEAQSFNSNQEYEKASFKFRTLEKTLSDSPMVKENYYNFFNSLNYYKMNNLDKAISQMEKAIYIPKYLEGRNIFAKDRDFYLGSFYSEIGNNALSLFYFSRTLEHGFSPLERNLERKVLTNLKYTNNKYKVIFDIIFEKNFSEISSLDENSLVEVAQYFFDSNRKLEAEEILTLGYNTRKKSLILNRLFLKVLFENKNYKKLLEISEKMIETEPRVSYFYYRGKAFKQLKNYPLAIFNLEKVHLQNLFNEQNIFEEEAATALLNLLFALEEYPKILEIVNSKDSYSKLGKYEQFLVILSYYKTLNFEKALNLSRDFIKENPSTYESNYLILLSRSSLDSKNRVSLDLINKFIESPSNFVLQWILNDFFNQLPLKERYSVKKEKLEKLEVISTFKNPDFLTLELDAENYPGDFITDIYEKNRYYHLAFLNSKQNSREFGKYKNFIPYLFPKYYKELVEENSKKYTLPEELIYTVILISSEFNEKNISLNDKIGLMGITPKTTQDINSLFYPERNIQLGSEKLSKIYKNSNQQPLPTLIEYLYGEDARKNILFENGDLNLFKITDVFLKKNIFSTLETYLFYKKTYEKID